ncbi:hypothetical protein [Streptosporangium sp. NPDC051022]|uniref:hypothetical protein n=1 Tax=Streptosporangium sp. NPDC051022 TaxID=3155752 RepID=UPI003447FD28
MRVPRGYWLDPWTRTHELLAAVHHEQTIVVADKRRKKEWRWPRPTWMEEAEKEAKRLRGGQPSQASMDRAMNMMMATARPRK